jgi:hypothetical protein
MDTPLTGPDVLLGYPAPYWFIVGFKVLGFALHMVPMHLWYAGLITMLFLRALAGDHGARLSGRVLNAMPVIVAYGINLGIIPLLFTQVAYNRVFYPATILMAWPWFSVVGLLMVSYYGVYLYVIGLRKGHLTRLHQTAGWIASGLFVILGFVFANAFSLMTRVEGWQENWLGFHVAGAPLGIGLNLTDPSMWPRWLMMLGLALMTTGAYVFIDQAFFAGQESDEHRAWARRTALILYTAGTAWFAVIGSFYLFVALPPETRALLLKGPSLVLTIITALSPGLPWLAILLGRTRPTRAIALSAGLAHFGVLALNAVSRQWVQNAELAPYLDVAAQPVNLEWSPLVLFLALFVAGLAVTGWMLAQVIKSPRSNPVV